MLCQNSLLSSPPNPFSEASDANGVGHFPRIVIGCDAPGAVSGNYALSSNTHILKHILKLFLHVVIQMKTLDCSGLVAATFTPMSPDGAVNLHRIPDYVDHLHNMKVQHVFGKYTRIIYIF